ncbi:hypothetical protein TNCV_1170801 [Trichonephila clavipes]|nr:hypothetical protein TNCV_1170801 [Trichonephila clavipes]
MAVGILMIRASDSRREGLGAMPDATKFPPSTRGVEIGGVAIYRPCGEFRRVNSYCHLYGAQGQRQTYFYAPCYDEFRKPRSDYVRQVSLETKTIPWNKFYAKKWINSITNEY